jgi:hypothetical protein
MDKLVKNELEIYLNKLRVNSVKESWVKKNLNLFYNFIINKEGSSISEKIYIFNFSKDFCKACGNETKFLSYYRGYRDFCSKKCSNGFEDLLKLKSESYKKNSLEKWGVDNPSKSEEIKERKRLTVTKPLS